VSDARRGAVLDALEIGPAWVRRDQADAPDDADALDATPAAIAPTEARDCGARADAAPAGGDPTISTTRPAMRPSTGKPATAPPRADPRAPPATSMTSATTGAPVDAARVDAILSADWAALEAQVSACIACGLATTRHRTVFGVGDRAADWLFVGEGPGADEDAKGEPFVGQAGRLLDSMLASIGLARGRDVFIANIVKCRPPGNRNPSPDETSACTPFLQRQIELIRPRLIVALGKVPATWLLGRDQSIASLRGQVHDHRGTPLLITYHPAYLLRNLPDKAKAWEDLCFARDLMAKLKAAA
jgi:DNA polymerase